MKLDVTFDQTDDTWTPLIRHKSRLSRTYHDHFRGLHTEADDRSRKRSKKHFRKSAFRLTT